MIALWIAAAILAGAAFGLIVLLSGRPVRAPADAARGVYRRQLTEVDDLAARGLLGEEERVAAHAEAARRLLGEEDDAPEAAPGKSASLIALISAAVVALVALGLYVVAGSPTTHDQSYAKRLEEWRQLSPSEMQPEQFIALTRKVLPTVPDKDKPLVLFALGQAEAAAGDAVSAERTFEKSLAGQPDRVEAWEALGEARMQISGGKFSPHVLEPFRKALELDPKLLTARYFLAKASIEEGKTQEGVAVLRQLRAESPPGAQQILDKEIAEAEGRTAPTPAVTADPAIVAMVNGLATRLKDNPDDIAGWQRLIRSYTVLNDKPALDKAMADARAYFKNRPADLATIEAAGKAPAPAPGQ
jgi:cytochrome c-type biogenesis protein CcmH